MFAHGLKFILKSVFEENIPCMKWGRSEVKVTGGKGPRQLLRNGPCCWDGSPRV